MIAFQCDRCGKFVTEEEPCKLTYENEVGTRIERDLCLDCARMLTLFMDNTNTKKGD